MELEILKNQIRQCRICEAYLPLGPNPVIRGNKSARILVAGQAPGIKVHETSIPFNDPSGDKLRLWMGVDKDLFYDEDKVAIIPMGFCYPGKGKSGDKPPRPECAATWHDQLLALYPNIELTLAIGIYSQAYHLKERRKNNLTETVRNWQEYLPEIIPLPHPSPRNIGWLIKNPWFEVEVLVYLKKRIQAIIN